MINVLEILVVCGRKSYLKIFYVIMFCDLIIYKVVVNFFLLF